MANERLTEKLHEEELKKWGFINPQWLFGNQRLKLDWLSKFPSKTEGSGRGSPDIIGGLANGVLTAIIIENKADLSKLIKLDENGKISTDPTHVKAFAVNGAYFYAKSVAELGNIFFAGGVGEFELDSVYFFIKNGHTDYIAIDKSIMMELAEDQKNATIKAINLFNKEYNITEKVEKTDKEVTIVRAKELGGDTHELIRDHGGISNVQKLHSISSSLAACANSGLSVDDENILSYTYSKDGELRTMSKKTNKDLKDGEVMFEASMDFIKTHITDPSSIKKFENTFSFLKTNDSLNKTISTFGYSTLIKLILMLRGKTTYKLSSNKCVDILGLFTNDRTNDVLGHFYSEFISYGGGDGKNLGIVLTPHPYPYLMLRLGGFSTETILYDPCAGTGGFLVAAIARWYELIYSNSSLTREEQNTKFKYCLENNLYACELEDSMYTTLSINLILRGANPANIYSGSCFDQFNIDRLKLRPPTMSISNPPYALKDANLKELKFIEHQLEVVAKGSPVITIVPKSIFLSKSKKLMSSVKKKHRLDTTITIPSSTFLEVAGVETAIGIFEAGVPYSKDKKLRVGIFDDGYDLLPKKGRIAVRDVTNLQKQLLDYQLNRKIIPGWFMEVNDTLESEDLYDCWESTQMPTDEDFKNKMLNFITFSIQRDIINLNKNGNIPRKIKDYELGKKEIPLTLRQWREFKVEDVFSFITNSQIESRIFIPGDTPIIQASSINNGLTACIGNEGLNIATNYITISLTGEPGIAFYHDYQCIPSSRVTGLLLKEQLLNKYTGIFLATCLEELKSKYSYGKSLSKSRLSKEKIWLPIKESSETDTDEIDFDFMEKYIKSFAFSEILE